MSSRLPPIPFQAPMLDTGGILTAVWKDWFKQAFDRMGGHVAETNEELYTVETARLDDLAVTTAKLDNAAVTAAKLAAAVAGDGLSGGAGSALSVAVDGSTLEVASDAVRIKDLGVATAKIAAGAVSYAKLLSTDWTGSQGASGYQKLPTGLYVQWGVTTSLASGSSTSINFPTAFPTGCLQVIAGIRDNSGIATTATGQWGTGNYSASSFSLYNRTSGALTFNWFAVGN